MEFYLKILEVTKINFLKPVYFARLKNILKFVEKNAKRAQLPANQFLLVVVDINIYRRMSYWMISNFNFWPSLARPTKSPYKINMVVSSPEQGHNKTVGAYPLS
jgi:hypothetical protein